MKWYDLFSNFYDNSLEKLYFDSRKRAIELLDLKDGHTIIDVACGTGANFRHIKATNKDISIYGTDFSAGMLEKAQNIIEKNNWKNIFLFQSDARNLNISLIEQHANKKVKFDRVICMLGLSVIPEWEAVLDNLLTLLTENGKIVIVDVFAEKRNFNTWLVEKVAKADLDRKIWQTLEKMTTNFYREYLPVKENKVGGRLFVAIGTKKK
ncbi:MAG: methyltransferase domain-containing protein [Sphingobacteriales bacterium]|jgi:ubiquinone/menaquinone biosynthesis C-methylase UbiE|nr:methyltransferase domain-containing protein [Sphingobacteriales bacterium]MBP9140813.1 methyltransferase domain-containing protein [Chitinophagales bacterium]MDA0198353.1 methyltransferase domain-containing protein [Bacteroidota bacterium]MBK6891205.1 methyltransferase domain-containing protein [Sphingobacteriales bacterium]MBK7526970.1 methyltransferase domain-containing protein [Sphingobacteriales bacterium]